MRLGRDEDEGLIEGRIEGDVGVVKRSLLKIVRELNDSIFR